MTRCIIAILCCFGLAACGAGFPYRGGPFEAKTEGSLRNAWVSFTRIELVEWGSFEWPLYEVAAIGRRTEAGQRVLDRRENTDEYRVSQFDYHFQDPSRPECLWVVAARPPNCPQGFMMTAPLWGEATGLLYQITAVTPQYSALWVSDDYASMVLARRDGVFAVVLSDKPVAPTEHLKKAREVLEENGFAPTDLKVVKP